MLEIHKGKEGGEERGERAVSAEGGNSDDEKTQTDHHPLSVARPHLPSFLVYGAFIRALRQTAVGAFSGVLQSLPGGIWIGVRIGLLFGRLATITSQLNLLGTGLRYLFVYTR